MMSAPRWPFRNFHVPLMEADAIPGTFLRESMLRVRLNGSSSVTSSHALIDIKLSFPDASGSYDVVLFGITQLRLVRIEIEVDRVLVEMCLEIRAIDIAFHDALAVPIECSIIPNLG